ncbi:PEP-utilizing enzyme [Streptomyces sp. NPDC052015]|uniref:PEP-utilizing enzyme n=1 Tax=Streptomyces sp. NPDC052015 TaxID=3154755 RepID=UPI00341B8C30
MDIALFTGPLRLDAVAELGQVQGVVAAIGGITSHPANILRAMGIPLLVAVSGVEQIPDDAYVDLDCDAGRLTVMACGSGI